MHLPSVSALRAAWTIKGGMTGNHKGEQAKAVVSGLSAGACWISTSGKSLVFL